MPAPTARTMSRDEIDALGVATDLRTAARALGVSASQGYALVKANAFPVPVVRVGSRIVVPTEGLRAALGLSPVED